MESESDPLTRRAIDLFKKEPLKGNSEVHLHTPTKFGEDRSKDLGGDREQTDRQTDKRCSIYSMMPHIFVEPEGVKKLLSSLNPNKAAGPDRISSRVLKELADELYRPLTTLFQNSLNSGFGTKPMEVSTGHTNFQEGR